MRPAHNFRSHIERGDPSRTGDEWALLGGSVVVGRIYDWSHKKDGY